MDKVTLVKREIVTSQWAEKIKICRESGMSVSSWCRENGISQKTYYYHLRKLRENLCEQIPVAVSTFPEQSSAAITVRTPSGITVEIRPLNGRYNRKRNLTVIDKLCEIASADCDVEWFSFIIAFIVLHNLC